MTDKAVLHFDIILIIELLKLLPIKCFHLFTKVFSERNNQLINTKKCSDLRNLAALSSYEKNLNPFCVESSYTNQITEPFCWLLFNLTYICWRF